jgi:CoA-transferase family III
MADTTSFPKHKVLNWPAVPTPTPDEVYAGLTDQAKEYPLSLEAQLRQSENFKKPECLTTVRVLDLSKGMIIGNWCSSMLSELGADTIKAEPPDGDPLRWQTPFGRKEYMLKDAENGEPIGLHFLH